MSGERLIVGVDPGTTTGMCLFDEGDDKIVQLWSSNFHEALNYCRVSAAYLYCVEVSSTKRVFHAPGSDLRANQRTAVNVGGVLREAELFALGLEYYGMKVLRIEPQGKMSADKFKKLTGWTGRSNEHTRDAALQVYRRRTGR